MCSIKNKEKYSFIDFNSLFPSHVIEEITTKEVILENKLNYSNKKAKSSNSASIDKFNTRIDQMFAKQTN